MVHSNQKYPSNAFQSYKKFILATVGLVLFVTIAGAVRLRAQTESPNFRRHAFTVGKPLTVYFIDVEGGQSTLFVTPSHQSLLVDTGWPDNDDRDADRIMQAVKLAGLDHIDYLLITHFHVDHVGGVPNLVKKIHVDTFIDHGVNRQTNDAVTEQAFERYQAVLAQSHARHILAKPGETIPLTGLTTTIVSADGKTIATALPGAGQPNPYCKGCPTRPPDKTENGRSVGFVMQYGKMRLVDLGDLTWDKEMQLMCPNNKLGEMDVYVVSHHGWYPSSSPAFVNGIAPRVAIMDNGEHKGGSPAPWETIEKSPRLKDLWQLHYSDEGGAEHNVATSYIANVRGASVKGGTDGHYIRLLAYPDGKLVVYNSRTGQSKTYLAPE
ncbi:MAG TPA: MBL fold metallo-hydrolase [Acidobacteriaceae bacterium]|nr:MBL fold metallo-hydrolase [Acidobacteriaceae bacterium]